MAIYAVVDKVVLEPNEQAPTQIQLWGTFAYGDLTPSTMTRACALSRLPRPERPSYPSTP
jgi:hypothetical protein